MRDSACGYHVFIQTGKGGISGAGVKVARTGVQVRSVYTSGLETRFCPLLCVFEGLNPEFCCLKVFSQTQLLFYDDVLTPAAPVLFIIMG